MAMIGKFTSYSFINANVFSAMQTRLANRSSEALAEEERQDKANGLTNIAALMRANNVRVSDRIDNIEDSVAVMFNDPKTNQRITLNLSNENLNRLKGQFGADNFYAREDGVIRLNGKAEAFVSGWFGDVAYQRNFAGADKDGSGRISGEEWRDVKGFSVSMRYTTSSMTETSLETYIDYGEADLLTSSTIEDKLNGVLEMDKNFDGQIERINEFEGGIAELVQETDSLIGALDREGANILGSQNNNIASSTRGQGALTHSEWKKNLEKLKKFREELDEQFAEQAKKAKERLEQNGKDDSATIEIPKSLETQTESQPNDEAKEVINAELAPVVEEIASKVASNDVQLFEVKI